MRFTPDIRQVMRDLVRKGYAKTFIAKLFDTTRQIVDRWFKRAKHIGREYFHRQTKETER